MQSNKARMNLLLVISGKGIVKAERAIAEDNSRTIRYECNNCQILMTFLRVDRNVGILKMFVYFWCFAQNNINDILEMQDTN